MPRMIVVAGPPGGGKSTVLGRLHFAAAGIPYFNIDEQCALLHGSSHRIPADVRERANDDLRSFCRTCVAGRVTFGFETTLRRDFAIRQAEVAKANGFETEMHYVALESVELHIARVLGRALAGGHSASEPVLRRIYADSVANLPRALRTFDESSVYDNSGNSARVVLGLRHQEVIRAAPPLPGWLKAALRGLYGQ